MKRIVDQLVSDRLVMAVIVLNATALVLHEMAPRGSSVRALWFWVDYVCVVFFLIEALIKIRRNGWRCYWTSGWNKFDFSVVVLSMPALLGPFLDVSQFAFVLILRLGRLFRLFIEESLKSVGDIPITWIAPLPITLGKKHVRESRMWRKIS